MAQQFSSSQNYSFSGYIQLFKVYYVNPYLALGPWNTNTGYSCSPYQTPTDSPLPPSKITYFSHRDCFFYYDFHLWPRLDITPHSEKQEQLRSRQSVNTTQSKSQNSTNVLFTSKKEKFHVAHETLIKISNYVKTRLRWVI